MNIPKKRFLFSLVMLLATSIFLVIGLRFVNANPAFAGDCADDSDVSTGLCNYSDSNGHQGCGGNVCVIGCYSNCVRCSGSEPSDTEGRFITSLRYCCPPCFQCGNGLYLGEQQCVGNQIYECGLVGDGPQASGQDCTCEGIAGENCDPDKVCEDYTDFSGGKQLAKARCVTPTPTPTATPIITPTPTPTPCPCYDGGTCHHLGSQICLILQGQADRVETCDGQNQNLGGWTITETCFIGTMCEITGGSPPNQQAGCIGTPTPPPTATPTPPPPPTATPPPTPIPTATPTPTPHPSPDCSTKEYPFSCGEGICPEGQVCSDINSLAGCQCTCDESNCGGNGPCPNGQYCSKGAGCGCVPCSTSSCGESWTGMAFTCESGQICKVNGSGGCYCVDECHCERTTIGLCPGQSNCEGECEDDSTSCTWSDGVIYNECTCQ